MSPLIIAGYLTICFMVAMLGYKTRLGFFRSFLFSILLTPFLVTLFLLILSTLEPEAKDAESQDETGKSIS